MIQRRRSRRNERTNGSSRSETTNARMILER
jgi:hypothetical protein